MAKIIELLEKIEGDQDMSKYFCELYKKPFWGGLRLIDDNCIIGFDEQMQTFFFQSGEENKYDEPLIWLGKKFKEFCSLQEIEKALAKKKYFLKIDQGSQI